MAKKRSKIKLDTSKDTLIASALYILVGVLFCLLRSSMLEIMMTVVGVLFIMYGVFRALEKDWIPCVIAVAAGVAIIVCGWTVAEIVLLILGIVLIVKGLLDLYNAANRHSGLYAVLGAVLTVLVGILLIVSKFAVIDWLFIVMGVILIIDGVLFLFGKHL